MSEEAGGSQGLMTVRVIAEHLGVTRQAVEKAIRSGRLPAYNPIGEALTPEARGHKFLKPEEAALAFTMNKARFDDAALEQLSADPGPGMLSIDGDDAASPSLVAAKTAREGLQADLLRMRIARERGELVSKAAVLDALETAGRDAARKLDSIITWAEELTGAAMNGGAGEVAALLRAKVVVLRSEIADSVVAFSTSDADGSEDPSDDEDDA